MSDIADLVRAEKPTAAIMAPWYGHSAITGHDVQPWTRGAVGRARQRNGWLFTSDDMFSLASQLETVIHEAHQMHGFEDITLIGHSAGALIARKAYVYGRGKTEDRDPWPYQSPIRPWATKVNRIVLAAGMNRGWSVSRSGVPLPTYLALKVVNLVIRIMGIGTWLTKRGRLVRSVERGSPFVANLRIQWIELREDLGDEEPTVVQLPGSIDPVVSNDDQADLAVHDTFAFIQVEGADHGTVIRLQEGPQNKRRQPFNADRHKALLKGRQARTTASPAACGRVSSESCPSSACLCG